MCMMIKKYSRKFRFFSSRDNNLYESKNLEREFCTTKKINETEDIIGSSRCVRPYLRRRKTEKKENITNMLETN